MSKPNEFWQYAEEAILCVDHANSDEERQALLDLARTWTQAALIEQRDLVDTGHTRPAALSVELGTRNGT